jgi:hypothetical protein
MEKKFFLDFPFNLYFIVFLPVGLVSSFAKHFKINFFKLSPFTSSKQRGNYPLETFL